MQVERAVAEIRGRIRAREYASGMHLVLRALAESLDMSIIPVRDALAELEQEGLVEGEAGRGWRVAAYNPESLRSLAELREALECQVARLCAARATEEELEELGLMARQADRADQSKDIATIAELEMRFHLRLAAIARSDKLRRAIERAHVLQLAFDPIEHDPIRDETHVRLVRAISRRDADAAEREMRKHCAGTAEALGVEPEKKKRCVKSGAGTK